MTEEQQREYVDELNLTEGLEIPYEYIVNQNEESLLKDPLREESPLFPPL